MKKIIILSVIVLFVGTCFQPAYAVEYKESPVKSKLVETSVRIHRARGITPYTLKLSEKESDEIDRIFDNLKVSLDSAETGEEIDEIYDNAVESLYELGLFPKDMTIDDAQQLVKGENRNPSGKSSSGDFESGDANFDCRISGEAIVCRHYYLGRLFRGFFLFYIILYFMRSFGNIFGPTGSFNLPYFQGRIGNIRFGECYWDGSSYYIPAVGWVWTNGTNGVIKWEGEFYGNIDKVLIGENPRFPDKLYDYTGVLWFEGLWVEKFLGPSCFLGNAEKVKIGYTPWPP